MKTTLNVDDHLLREAKKLAADRGQTLTALIEGALREAIAAGRTPRRKPLMLPTVHGRGLPDVDIADRDALYERLDGRR